MSLRNWNKPSNAWIIDTWCKCFVSILKSTTFWEFPLLLSAISDLQFNCRIIMVTCVKPQITSSFKYVQFKEQFIDFIAVPWQFSPFSLLKRLFC